MEIRNARAVTGSSFRADVSNKAEGRTSMIPYLLVCKHRLRRERVLTPSSVMLYFRPTRGLTRRGRSTEYGVHTDSTSTEWLCTTILSCPEDSVRSPQTDLANPTNYCRLTLQCNIHPLPGICTSASPILGTVMMITLLSRRR